MYLTKENEKYLKLYGWVLYNQGKQVWGEHEVGGVNLPFLRWIPSLTPYYSGVVVVFLSQVCLLFKNRNFPSTSSVVQ